MRYKLTITAAGVEILEDGTFRELTLEQYEKHARDPEFVGGIPLEDHAKVLAARRVERELEAAARQAAADAERAELDRALADSDARRVK